MFAKRSRCSSNRQNACACPALLAAAEGFHFHVGSYARSVGARWPAYPGSRGGVPRSRRTLRAHPYAMRERSQYAVCWLGDLVEVDILDVRPLPGPVLKQFTAARSRLSALPACAGSFCSRVLPNSPAASSVPVALAPKNLIKSCPASPRMKKLNRELRQSEKNQRLRNEKRQQPTGRVYRFEI